MKLNKREDERKNKKLHNESHNLIINFSDFKNIYFQHYIKSFLFKIFKIVENNEKVMINMYVSGI